MRPKQTKFLVRGGRLFGDGKEVSLEPFLVALVLVADGYSDVEEGSLTQETAQRLLRIRSSILLSRRLEDAGLLTTDPIGFLDEEVPDSVGTSPPSFPEPARSPQDDLA